METDFGLLKGMHNWQCPYIPGKDREVVRLTLFLTISSYAMAYLDRKTTVTRYNNHIAFTETAQMHKVIMRGAQSACLI